MDKTEIKNNLISLIFEKQSNVWIKDKTEEY